MLVLHGWNLDIILFIMASINNSKRNLLCVFFNLLCFAFYISNNVFGYIYNVPHINNQTKNHATINSHIGNVFNGNIHLINQSLEWMILGLWPKNNNKPASSTSVQPWHFLHSNIFRVAQGLLILLSNPFRRGWKLTCEIIFSCCTVWLYS